METISLQFIVDWLGIKYSLDIAHYIKTFHRKPGALPNSRVLAQADELIRDAFNRYYANDPKNFCLFLT